MSQDFDVINTLPIFFSPREERKYKFCEAYRNWKIALDSAMTHAEREKIWEDYVIEREKWLTHNS